MNTDVDLNDSSLAMEAGLDDSCSGLNISINIEEIEILYVHMCCIFKFRIWKSLLDLADFLKDNSLFGKESTLSWKIKLLWLSRLNADSYSKVELWLFFYDSESDLELNGASVNKREEERKPSLVSV